MVKFLTIDGGLLRNRHINSGNKLVLSLVANFENSGYSFFGGLKYIADTFGITEEMADDIVSKMIEKGWLSRSGNALSLAMTIEELAAWEPSFKEVL